jgi:hypothetical protein
VIRAPTFHQPFHHGNKRLAIVLHFLGGHIPFGAERAPVHRNLVGGCQLAKPGN